MLTNGCYQNSEGPEKAETFSDIWELEDLSSHHIGYGHFLKSVTLLLTFYNGEQWGDLNATVHFFERPVSISGSGWAAQKSAIDRFTLEKFRNNPLFPSSRLTSREITG